MQLHQLSKRDVTLILQGHQEHGARPWEICSLVSKAGTILVPPGGQVVSILAFSTFGNASMKHGVTPVPRFSEWPKISKGVSTHAIDKQEYALHQVEFAKKGGILPQDGAVRWSLQLQCKLVGDGHEGWVSFANKLNEVCGAGAVQHLGGLHTSELTVAAQPVMDTSRVSVSVMA